MERLQVRKRAIPSTRSETKAERDKREAEQAQRMRAMAVYDSLPHHQRRLAQEVGMAKAMRAIANGEVK